ncbi:MAG: ferredoxin--NADP reductase [Gammaproteobacteria bacterium]|nr:ferredoxin--NADP reductase [Gammaproteobacteria bacterium]
MARWTEGTVVDNYHWNDQLYSLKIKADIPPFKAGQFGRLGLDIDGERIGRPYSFVNAPTEQPLEFYSIIVPEGPLSNRLHSLKAGDKVWVSPKGAGFFTLSEVPQADYLWMLSTGTALGPFLSILKEEEPWERFKKIVLVHAVRTTAELTYRDTIESFSKSHPDQFAIIPFVSREDTDFALKGRIPAAIQDGRLQHQADMSFDPEQSHVMLCGNPGMVKDTSEVLMNLGFKKNRRREPGQITTENYW